MSVRWPSIRSWTKNHISDITVLKLISTKPPKNCVLPEKAMAPHSSTLAWKIPWMEEPGALQTMGSWRVRHDWETSLSLFTFTFHFHFSLSCIGEGNGNPLQCSCLENPSDGGAWWAAVYGVAQSQTLLKQLSSSSNSREVNPFSPEIFNMQTHTQFFFQDAQTFTKTEIWLSDVEINMSQSCFLTDCHVWKWFQWEQ